MEFSLPRRIWRAAYPPLIYLGVSFAAAFIAMLALTLYHSILAGWQAQAGGFDVDMNAVAERIEALLEDAQLWIQLATCAVCAAVFWPLWKAARRRMAVYSGTRLTSQTVFLAVTLGIGMNLFLIFVIAAFDLERLFPSHELLGDILGSGGLAIQLLAIGIAAPVAEELCFRGVVLGRLLTWTPAWVAVAVSSLLFGLIHLIPLQIIYAALGGAVWAWVYVRFRNLWLCIIGHMAFNVFNVVLVHAAGDADINIWLILLASLPLLAASVYLLRKQPLPVTPPEPV